MLFSYLAKRFVCRTLRSEIEKWVIYSIDNKIISTKEKIGAKREKKKTTIIADGINSIATWIHLANDIQKKTVACDQFKSKLKLSFLSGRQRDILMKNFIKLATDGQKNNSSTFI